MVPVPRERENQSTHPRQQAGKNTGWFAPEIQINLGEQIEGLLAFYLPDLHDEVRFSLDDQDDFILPVTIDVRR